MLSNTRPPAFAIGPYDTLVLGVNGRHLRRRAAAGRAVRPADALVVVDDEGGGAVRAQRSLERVARLQATHSIVISSDRLFECACVAMYTLTD